jgi:peptidoglycan/xylan/chitin deacetylase (PgdA/CDA1 family)
LTDLKAKTGQKRAVLVEEIEATLQVEHDQNECFAFLSDGEVKEMHQTGLITIGAHTANHELLTQVSLEEAEKTVMMNYQDLKAIIDHDVNFISYPNGNYNMKIVELMHALPFKAAFTTKSVLYTRQYAVFEIPRIGVGGYDGNADILIKMCGLKKMISL